MKIAYIEKNFRQSSLDLIESANDILDEYRGAGYTLTLRQLYYQFVSRDLVANNQKSYDRIGSIISDARLAGLVSWTAIEDRNRTCSTPFIENDASSVLDGLQYGYQPDLWLDQENYVEVWVEKDALINVVERPANRWNVAHMACKGYMSSSEMWAAANRFNDAENDGKQCHLIHLGDHDPSGIDMTRDNGDRLRLFNTSVQVNRIALNFDQIEEYGPPPNPTKMTDSRAADYLAVHGDTSWELDALPPATIEALVESNIKHLVDTEMMYEARSSRDEERRMLEWISDNSEQVFDFARTEMDY